MPIEIKELHIRIAVNASGAATAGGSQASGGGHSGGDEEATNATVAECVEQVLQILQNRADR